MHLFSYLCSTFDYSNNIIYTIMALTNEKLTIVGAAGMIGSNMAQTALMMGLTTEICLYDVFSPEGVAEEMRQSGFDDVNIVATTDAEEAFKNAKYIISSGGAPRKAGMTREDLLAGNCKIAEELGQNIKKFCPEPRCKTRGYHLQPCRPYWSGNPALLWSETRTGNYPRRSRHDPSAERTGQEVRCDAESDHWLRYLWWPR